MNFKKLTAILLCTSLLLITSSCKNVPPSSAKEELPLYEWTITDLSGSPHGTLSFPDGKMKISDELLDFTGDCTMDHNTITVNSQNYGIISVSYTLQGDSLELAFLGKKISLKKK